MAVLLSDHEPLIFLTAQQRERAASEIILNIAGGKKTVGRFLFDGLLFGPRSPSPPHPLTPPLASFASFLPPLSAGLIKKKCGGVTPFSLSVLLGHRMGQSHGKKLSTINKNLKRLDQGGQAGTAGEERGWLAGGGGKKSPPPPPPHILLVAQIFSFLKWWVMVGLGAFFWGGGRAPPFFFWFGRRAWFGRVWCRRRA